MITKTKIEKKLGRKENPRLRKIIILLKKQKNKFWLYIANLLARPKRQAISVNLEKIDRFTKADDKVIVPGKLLGQGNLGHSIRLYAFSISQSAKEKLKNAQIVSIEEMIKESPAGKGVKLII